MKSRLAHASKQRTLATVFALVFFLLPTICLASKLQTMPFNKPGPGKLDCAVTVMFSSFASGIDEVAFGKVEGFVETNPAISSAQLYPWGMEGEKTLCLAVSADQSAAVFDGIKNIISKTAIGAATLTNGDKTYSTNSR